MSRCKACEWGCRFVPPDGPQPCEFLFVGEKPGREEDARGRPFIGDTGAEFNRNYLGLAGLTRDDVRITNTVKCRLGGNNNKPTEQQVRACAGHHLPGEIAECGPMAIVLMGATACSLLPKVELDKDHGIPLWVDQGESDFFGDWEGYVIPMYHPAAGLHDTGMMVPLLEDFERIGNWRDGKWKPVSASSAGEVDYQIIDETSVLTRIIERGIGCIPAIDTEDDCGEPWSTQFSFRRGTGYIIFRDRHDLLRCLFDSSEEFVFHHAGHDLAVLEALGIRVHKWRDTMQEAYHLGNLPQGLKALAWRLRGIRMQSWEDLVMPDSRRKAIEYLTGHWDDASDNRIRVETQLKTKVRVEWKPTEKERVLKRILSHSHKPDYDLWEKVQENEHVQNIFPGMPRPSIAHVELSKAVFYACQDADVTGQVAVELQQMRDYLHQHDWCVPESDWDK